MYAMFDYFLIEGFDMETFICKVSK